MSKKIIYALIIILVIIAGAAVFIRQFSGQQEETGANGGKESNKHLSYFRSINDDETMALAGTHEFWRKGNNLYITSIKDHGLNVFDISDPANPKFISAFSDDEKTLMKRGHSVMFSGNYAFVSATGDNAIQVFDISDPIKISPVSIIKEKEGEKSCLKGLHGIGIKGNYLYAAGTGDNSVCIADISDPKNPRLVKTIFDSGELVLRGPHSIHFIENYLYVLGDEGLQVFDISEPTNPKPVFLTTEGVKGGHDLKQKGNYLYTVGYQDGLSVFNVTNPKEPVRIAGISPAEESGLYFASDGDIIGNYWFVVSEKSNSLIMVDISSPSNPTIKEILRIDEEKTPFLYNGHTIRAIGNYLYVAGLQDGFGIIKFSETVK